MINHIDRQPLNAPNHSMIIQDLCNMFIIILVLQVFTSMQVYFSPYFNLLHKLVNPFRPKQ